MRNRPRRSTYRVRRRATLRRLHHRRRTVKGGACGSCMLSQS